MGRMITNAATKGAESSGGASGIFHLHYLHNNFNKTLLHFTLMTDDNIFRAIDEFLCLLTNSLV